MADQNMTSVLREQDFPIIAHNHGKSRVRVLKVNRDSEKHEVYEYEVATKLFNDAYEKVFTELDNEGLVATDTQRNTVYVIAKRTEANSPEQFGIDLCTHFLTEYPMLTGVEVDVNMTKWSRAVVEGKPHNHGFVKESPELESSNVKMTRAESSVDLNPPTVTSFIKNMTILKTTNSGFESYLVDKFTLLPQTSERCMATELDCTWTYEDDGKEANKKKVDYSSIRKKLREQIYLGFFGPANKGVYSASLQATIYDICCLILQAVPQIKSTKVDTPNLHYLPMKLLEKLGEKFEDDIFVPTSEPSGTITCTVGRATE